MYMYVMYVYLVMYMYTHMYTILLYLPQANKVVSASDVLKEKQIYRNNSLKLATWKEHQAHRDRKIADLKTLIEMCDDDDEGISEKRLYKRQLKAVLIEETSAPPDFSVIPSSVGSTITTITVDNSPKDSLMSPIIPVDDETLRVTVNDEREHNVAVNDDLENNVDGDIEFAKHFIVQDYIDDDDELSHNIGVDEESDNNSDEDDEIENTVEHVVVHVHEPLSNTFDEYRRCCFGECCNVVDDGDGQCAFCTGSYFKAGHNKPIFCTEHIHHNFHIGARKRSQLPSPADDDTDDDIPFPDKRKKRSNKR